MTLTLDELAKDYGDGHGLQPTSFTLTRGELALLVGHNGAGKSTLLGLCNGSLQPTQGTVTVNGEPAGSLAARTATATIPDHPVLYDDLSVLEHAQYIARLHSVEDWRPITGRLLDRLGLADRAEDLPSRFSRGMRQKDSILLALVRPRNVLLIDEPFVGLDQPTQSTLIELLTETAAAGTAVLVSSHQLNLADAATRCIALRDGQVIHDGPASADLVRDLSRT